ncbi:unnamed protein product [Bursaphelenchus okinawaensis]|uniref:Aminopeptidase n=1 Tax=Bursaphelenchus okinawaensis TaxID=465554 RepID=A0A811KRK1_9BILA|nr:unnamed protein product [Bursaphelenchus okinawaensis]CAG9108223.1 unnamed protein product [Bursaphelenchus okinawaensis]
MYSKIKITFLDEDGFIGTTSILVQFSNSTDRLVLDAQDLRVTTVTINDKYEEDWTLNKKKLTIIEDLKPTVVYNISIEYHGTINSHKLGGLYKSLYKKNTKALLVTHLEPDKARMLFPCIDDPTVKSKFIVSLTVPQGLTVFGNSRIAKTDIVNKTLKKVIFANSPFMSTFLVAFVVGDFRTESIKYKDRINVTVATIAGNKENLSTVIKYAVDCLEYMEDYTGFKYPGRKLDHVDVLKLPTLAMQNFGLITYANSFSQTSSLTLAEELEQRRLICHETAHQWFSNIITTADWGQIFLHEGFATFFENALFKNMTNEDKLAVESKRVQEFHDGILEKVHNGHSIVVDKFVSDETVYLSAGSVIKMIENVIGSQTLRKTLQLLVKQHAYSNFNYIDLLNAFKKTNDRNLCGNTVTLRTFIQPYLLQKEVPVIRVTNTSTSYVLTQHGNTRFDIPLFVSDGTQSQVLWLTKENQICGNTAILNTNKTLVFNYQYQSFVKLQYDDDIYWRYDKSISRIDDFTVYNILSNTKDYLTTKKFMNIAIAALRSRRSGLVWKVVIDYVYEHDLGVSKAFQKVLLQAENSLIWNNTNDPMLRSLQADLSSFLVDFEVGNALKSAHNLYIQRFSKCKSDFWRCNKIPVELRSAVYCAAVKNNGTNAKFLQKYLLYLKKESLVPNDYEFEVAAINNGLQCA